MKKKLSVVLTTYDESIDELRRSIRSVREQTLESLELIITNDNPDRDLQGSIDGIGENEFTLIQHETNRGGSAARNTVVSEADGEYVAFLDADDEWLPTKV
jgi:glycosyltransferase involved in cell wall biosynthesis